MLFMVEMDLDVPYDVDKAQFEDMKAREKARSLGINMIWDCEVAKTPEGFYQVHAQRPFFGSLCAFMSSGPCITMVLERENACAQG